MTASPWLKFYPSDWRSDPALRVCSLEARGLWMEMLCVMHEAEPRGHLKLNGISLSNKQLTALVGGSVKDVQNALVELEVAGVFSRDKGTIISRRMVRDTVKAEQDKANGKSGGNPRLNGGVNPQLNGHDNASLNGEDKAQKLEAREPEEEKDIRTKPARRRVLYPPLFSEFWKAYPTDELMSKAKAYGAWQKLTTGEQESAITAIPAFRGYCKAHPDYRPVHAVRFISEGRYDGFAGVAARSAEQIFVKRGTPEWEAWEKTYVEQHGKTPPVDSNGGWFFPTEFPQSIQRHQHREEKIA